MYPLLGDQTSGERDHRQRLASSEEAIRFLAPGFAEMRCEALRVVHLDASRRVIGVRLHYSELCTAVDFPLRRILADALTLQTDGLLVAHNHPSGDPSPSRDDLIATRALAELVRPLAIRLHDHLIFAADKYRSFRGMGLL